MPSLKLYHGLNLTLIRNLQKRISEIQRFRSFAETIISAMPGVAAVVDYKHNVLYMNRALSGGPGDANVGKKCWTAFGIDKGLCLGQLCRSHDRIGKTNVIESDDPKTGKSYLLSYTGILMPDGNVGTLQVLSDVTVIKKTEEELKQRIEIEKLVASVSYRVLILSINRVHEGIQSALREIGEFTGADRCYVFNFSDDKRLMSNTYEWCRKGVSPQIGKLQSLPTKLFPWWMSQLNKFEIINLPSLSHIPPKADSERTILAAQKIKSLLVVPMVRGDTLVGFIGLDSVRKEMYWSTELLNMLRLVSDIITNALERKKSQLMLSQERDFISGILDCAGAQIVTLNRNLEIMDFNKECQKKSGYTLDEVRGRKMWDFLVSPKDKESLKSNLKRIVATLRPARLVTSCMAKNKTSRLIAWHYTFVKDAQGKVNYVIGVGNDITQQQEAEDSLSESEKMYSTLVERSTDGVAIVQDGRWKFVNKAMIQVTGFCRIELIEKPFLDLIAPEFRKYVAQIYRLRLKGKKMPGRYEIKVRCKDGRTIDVEVSAILIEYRGKPATMAIVRDITEKKLAEAKIIESEEKFRHMFDSSSSALLIADRNTGLIIDANQQAAKLFHRPRKELIGMHQTKIHPPRKAKYYAQVFKRHCRAGSKTDERAEIVTKDGRVVPVHISARSEVVGGKPLLFGTFRRIGKDNRRS